MKVSIAWIGVFILITFFLYFAWYGKTVYEAFTVPVKEGFEDTPTITGIQITTCPVRSNRYINEMGFTVCCDGQVESGTCNGETICSLSETFKNVPTCSDWYAAYLKERGYGKCSGSTPIYFENPDGTSGCTDGVLTPAGDAPADPDTAATCKIYDTEIDNMGKLDSCLNAKYLESSVCFTDGNSPVVTSLIEMGGGKQPALVSCTYGNTSTLDQTSGVCYTDDSIVRNKKAQIDAINKTTGGHQTISEWQATSSEWDPMYKLNFCSVVQKYKVSKTTTCDLLSGLAVFNSK
jgi:hypothetical protein